MISATEIFCLNELGKRSNNEDCIFPPKGKATVNDRLFIVCDGVGGEKKGEVASQVACHSIHEYFQKKMPENETEMEMLQKSIYHAKAQITAYAATDPDAIRMSTTLALVFLGQASVIAAWCGDTRIHHIRNGKVLWKSKDHSLVSELVSQGELSEEDAKKHPQRNVITRSLNALNYNSTAEFYEIKDFHTGDYLLLCTDGFLEKVDENVIHAILADVEKDKAKLFFSHCQGLTRDNFSMYLIRGQHDQNKKQPSSKKHNTLLIAFIIILIFFIFFLIKNIK